MAIKQFMLAGDSLPLGKVGDHEYRAAGLGTFAELVADRLANIPGIGPQLGPGIIGCWRTSNTADWGFASTWTAVASTDAFDKLPYGFGNYSAAGSTRIATFTPSVYWRPIVCFEIGYVDYTSAGDWQYRIDGGTWTNMGQTIAHDNAVKKFFVNTPITSTLEIRAYDGAAGVGCFPAFVRPYWTDPRGLTNGFILDNISYGAHKLNDLTAATSGDRMAIIDSVVLGTGSPISHRPNVAFVNMNINDTLLASTATWDTDLTTLNARVAPIVPLGLISPWGVDTVARNDTQQTNYRAHTKTTAASFSTPAKVLDLFDAWNANGWGSTNALQASQGIADARLESDGVHEAQLGHLDVADRVYWWIRTNFFTIGKAGNVFSVGSSPLGTATALLGGQVETILPDGKAIQVVGGSPTLHATNVRPITGKAIQVVGGAPTIHAANTISPSGHAIAITGGVPTIHAASTISITGKAIQVVGGGPIALVGPGTIPAFGLAIQVVGGTPTIHVGAVTIAASGHPITIAGGQPTLHSTTRISPAGKAILVAGGTPTVTAGPIVLHIAGVPIVVSGGQPIIFGGVSEPATATLSVVGHARATVAVLPHATATVSV